METESYISLGGTIILLALFAQKYRLQLEYRSAIQVPSTMVPGISIVNHLNNEQVKNHYTNVSAIQMFTYQIPTVQW